MLRGILVESSIIRPAGKAAIQFTPIFKHMKKVKVYLLIGATGSEKTLTLEPRRWDVRVFSYRDKTPHGDNVVSIGIEDWPVMSEADDWKDLIITMRKITKEGGEPVLIIEIHYLMDFPGNLCKVWYDEELIYDNTRDGWRKRVELPWT